MAEAATGQRDDAAAGHTRRKEIDRPACQAIITARRQHGVEPHVARQLHDAAARSGADGAGLGVDDGLDARALAQRGDAVGLEQRRGGDRVAFEPGTAGRQRNGGKNDGGEQADDRQHADAFEQDVAILPRRRLNATRWPAYSLECSKYRQRFQCRPPDHPNRTRRSRRALVRPGTYTRNRVPTDRSERLRLLDTDRSTLARCPAAAPARSSRRWIPDSVPYRGKKGRARLRSSRSGSSPP